MSTKAGTVKAVNLIQYCTAWTKVMDRMPPAPTARMTTMATTVPPTQPGTSATIWSTSEAPWSWGTR